MTVFLSACPSVCPGSSPGPHVFKRRQSCRLCLHRKFILLWIVQWTSNLTSFSLAFSLSSCNRPSPGSHLLPHHIDTHLASHMWLLLHSSLYPHRAPVATLDLPPLSTFRCWHPLIETQRNGPVILQPQHHQIFAPLFVGRWPVLVKLCSGLFCYGQAKMRRETSSHCHGSLGG